MSLYVPDRYGKNPQIQNAIQMLDKKDMIKPGTIVPGALVEEVLEMPYSENWSFRGPFISLIAAIEARGYFCTQAKIPAPGIRIMDTDEAADRGKQKYLRALLDNYKTAYILSAMDISELTEAQQKDHKATQYRCAQAAMQQHKILFDGEIF